jgi:hypothetical protein
MNHFIAASWYDDICKVLILYDAIETQKLYDKNEIGMGLKKLF